jgi:hypothetical protein
MNLNLNEIINRFFTLSLIINKKKLQLNSVDKSSKFNKRFINLMQINSSQKNINVFVLFRYKFKSSSRLKRSFNKSTSSNYQSNSNTQSTRNSKKWKKIIFSILQYNVKNNENEIIISLLTNSQIKKYDILTIQKF